jgi:hypothetical protein
MTLYNTNTVRPVDFVGLREIMSIYTEVIVGLSWINLSIYAKVIVGLS